MLKSILKFACIGLAEYDLNQYLLKKEEFEYGIGMD